MIKSITELDRILRGDATRPDVAPGELPRIDASARRLFGIELLLAVFYGLCMGCFAVVSDRAGTWKQMLSSALKVPALFFLTLIVTLPSLYVFNALVGSRLRARGLLKLLAAGMGVTLALLASFGTIIAFFSFTTQSHPFMVLLNVAAFVIAGSMGLNFLMRTLRTLSDEGPVAPPGMPLGMPPLPPTATEVPLESQPPKEAAPVSDATAAAVGELREFQRQRAADRTSYQRHLQQQRATAVFRIWVILFALVGAQMSWVLRPFIGGQQDFAIFRAKGSNFFEAVYHLTVKLFSGG